MLIRKHDGLGLGALAFERLSDLAFEKIVVKWREQAWKDHKELVKNPKLINKIHTNAEATAKELIEIFGVI